MEKRITLKRLLAEAFYYDIGKEKDEFDRSIATATEGAKENFEKSMREKVLGQKVKVRASRGQPGQPEKDYVLDKVSDVSVDWYFKQYVVVFKDGKGKEYFLKPDFKVQVLSAAAPGEGEKDAPQQEPVGSEPAPNKPTPVGTPPPASAKAGAVAPGGQTPQPKPPVAEQETAPATSQASAGGQYKKEWVASEMRDVLLDYVNDSVRKQAEVDRGWPSKYVRSAAWKSGSAEGSSEAIWVIEIPEKDMMPGFDQKELQLAIANGLRSYGGPGQQFTRAYADIIKVAQTYRITVHYTVGWDV